MTNLEKTFDAMAKSCMNYGRGKEIVWISNPVIKPIFELLEVKSSLLDAASSLQIESDTSGHFTNKNGRLENLIKRTYKMSRKLSLYAKLTNNQILLNDVDISESSFQKEGDDAVLSFCNLIVKRGREQLDATSVYGVTADELNGIEADVLAFKQLPATITLVNSDHKAATKNIKQAIADVRIVLDQLDDAFEGLLDDQAFIDGWFDVRKIKGRHHYKKVAETPQAAKAVLEA
jgi:hypothetical protein